MSGSNDSGDDLEAGRVNRASSHTRIWMSNSKDGDSFEGHAILIVEPQLALRDERVPIDDPPDVIGVMGTGSKKAAGVVGTGGDVSGIGVIGQGGGTKAPGTGVLGLGTFGLHGVGTSTVFETALPGVGLVAQGGRRPPEDEHHLLHGAGVIAMAGGADQPIPGLDVTGSVGVYAQGGDAQTVTTRKGKETFITGQPRPGPGVVGIGGTTLTERALPASGVIGFAGGTGGAPDYWMSTCGVYGAGETGVAGWSSSGPGLRGFSEGDRGGRFESEKAAQVNLAPSGSLKTAKGLREGDAGDLLVTMDGNIATLWFCKRSSGNQGDAEWVEVA